jgi:hypothetical protein
MEDVEDGQVEELRRWAQGLADDDRPEVKAAAKAILLLADDVEAARSQLLEERLIRRALEASQEQETVAGEPPEPEHPDSVDRALVSRVRSFLHLSRR